MDDQSVNDGKILEIILRDMLRKTLPPEVAEYFTSKEFSNNIRTTFSSKANEKDFMIILGSTFPEYRSFAIFAARYVNSAALNKKIFESFSDSIENVKVRIAAMYHLAGISYVKGKERTLFLSFCEENKKEVEIEARRYYGAMGSVSDEEMLKHITNRLNDNRYTNVIFLHLYNLGFITDPEAKKKAAILAKAFLEHDDDIVKETALMIASSE
ncbi:MAG: hypothetical protein H8D67_10995 [Deltaproteobacteria bacterium]|nr:hypothetical protein [Deltaproteobacteria bacterium]MBL7204161.1 hypothetical protein [Desulfobacteraceae bacterium]